MAFEINMLVVLIKSF